MKKPVTLQPFKFPDHLQTDLPTSNGGKEFVEDNRPRIKIPVGTLTDSEASRYWDELKEDWMAHVQGLREELEGDEDED